jgi:hypothetical protein
MEFATSATVDSPRSQRILISLSSAGVSVMDLFGGIEFRKSPSGCLPSLFGLTNN